MDQGRIWSHFQNHRREYFEQSVPRLKYLLNDIPSQARVLNIGIGGALFEELCIRKQVEIHALDPDAGAVERVARDLGLADRAKTGSVDQIPFAETYFDFVVASEILEHLDSETLSRGLSEIARVLKPGGYFVGTVPANENLIDLFTVCPHCGGEFHRWGHQQSFNRERLDTVLSTAFLVEAIRLKFFPYFKSLSALGVIVDFVRMIATEAGVQLKDQRWYFRCRKGSVTNNDRKIENK